MFRKILIAVVASLGCLSPFALPAQSEAHEVVVHRHHRYQVYYRNCNHEAWRCAGSFGCRVWLKNLISSSALETFSPRSWIGSLFFVGTEKYPSLFRSFFVESHQRFHSGSVKISPSTIWLI